MTTYGLTSTGFVPKTQSVIEEELFASWRSLLGASIATHSRSVLGQIGTIFAAMIAELWEIGEQINASQDPDAATGASLDSLAALTGTVRRSATRSSVTLTLTGDDGTTVTSGSRSATSSTEQEFSHVEDVDLELLISWASTTAYVVGDRRTNADRSYVCITAGTSAGSGGPTTTASDITDGTAHWRYMGEGDAVADVEAQSVLFGPVTAVSGDITTMITPTGGWRSVINLLDADLGSDVESDANLRLRRQVELAAPGTSTADAIEAAISQLDGVISVRVFVNNTDVTDSDGIPPHSIEVLVRGGVNQEIIDMIFANVAAGIGTHNSGAGAVTGSATDSQGVSHTIRFTRPDEIEIFVDVVGLIYDALTFPSDGQDQIKQKIVEWGDLQSTGKNAVSSAILAQVHKVTGVLDAGLPEIGLSPSPTLTTTIQISNREIAVYDTSRIEIISPTTGTP